MEEGHAASSVLRDNQWEDELVRKEKPDLSEDKRRLIVFTLLDIKKGRTLPWGAQTKLAAEVGVHKSTVNRLFKKAMQATQQGGSIDVSSKRYGNCGKKRKYENSDEWLESCPLHLRGTVRSYAGYLGCSAAHIWRLIKQGILRAHTSANHPHVSECNKLQRMKWVLNHIIPATETEKAKFVEMKNVVHIDEKWFNLNPGTRRLYLLPKEVDPYRCSKSKNYSIKVMFLAATSRPIYAEDGQMLHDGKFGIWPFVFQEQAKNNSKNRPAGTWETKVETRVTQGVTREMLINKVLPCIREKWPAFLPKDILIQQDNAKPHITNSDPAFRAAATQDGFNMVLINQPPQSPDFNILDLGLFRALQSLQHQAFPTTIDELVLRVEESYFNFDPHLIKFVWITLQHVMIEALKHKGGNDFKIPHIGKARLERIGELKEVVEVDQEVIDEALEYINQQELIQSQLRRTQRQPVGQGGTQRQTQEERGSPMDTEQHGMSQCKQKRKVELKFRQRSKTLGLKLKK